MNKTLILESRIKFGIFFKDCRKKRGLTQQEVAVSCGVTYQTINKIEQGKYAYSIDLLFALSIVLGFSFDLIFKENKNQRFLLQKSNTNPKEYVVTDTENIIVCTFEYKRYNETQNFRFLNDTQFNANKIATIMREFADWIWKNHADIA